MSDNDLPPGGSTLAELIERTRGRARSLAGLVATAAGAVMAGILFSPAAVGFGVAASIFSGVAVVLLLICLGFLVYAQIVTKVTEQSRPPQTDDERALSSVRARTRDGLIAGVIALTAISATLAVVIAERLTQENQVTLHISDEGKPRIRVLCPRIASTLVGTVSEKMRLATQKDRIDIEVAAEVCGSKKSLTLIIPVNDVVGWSE